EWAMKTLTTWGLTNAHQERWKFGKGWTLQGFHATLLEPQVQPIIGFPMEWSSGTKGTVTAEVVRAQLANDADLERFRGKLGGKIVLMQPARAVRMLEGPIILRMDEKWTAEAETTPIPEPGGGRAGRGRGGQEFRDRLERFLSSEGVVAVFERGSDSDMADGGSTLSWKQQHPDGGTIFPAGSGPRDENAGRNVPRVTLAVEHYNRMIRVLDKNLPVRVELNIDVKFHDENPGGGGFNTIADLAGTDPALSSEVVLLGAHFDSHPYATGATDNATGSAAMMEAVRILKAIGVRPRRTIRIALWGGEEEGLLGSRAYVADHIADVTTMALKPEHAKLAAYFNSDNGTGRVRGVWMQSNLAVRPIFEQWMAPLKDLGVTILSPRSVQQTDHVSFDNAGIPAFQFLVDRLEYNSRTHHSNIDTVDHIVRDDLIQQATVIAVFAYDAAMRDERLPRKALPPPQRAGRGSQH
ncbi:MAG TPA: M20/M25/M40 family metallo-hydrolase, partial [Vicinamibacterales bacterium]|nr:M20/M25/M40 family metallo-hydrolase [Vicinamibacterales bacterium]